MTEAKDRLSEWLGDRAVFAAVRNVAEERRELILAELRGQNFHGVNGVVETAGRLGRGTALEEVGAEGLVAALERMAGFAEELPGVAHAGSCISQQ